MSPGRRRWDTRAIRCITPYTTAITPTTSNTPLPSAANIPSLLEDHTLDFIPNRACNDHYEREDEETHFVRAAHDRRHDRPVRAGPAPHTGLLLAGCPRV